MTFRTPAAAVRLGVLLVLLVALVAGTARLAGAQASAPLRLSLGDAARLAARQSALAEAARLRADQAEARVTQRRADLLPNLGLVAGQNGHTLNTVTFGLDISGPEGPLFDPSGEVIGPVNTADVRARVSQNLLDVAAIQRVRSARASARASDADAANAAEQAAALAAAAWLRTARAEAEVRARTADSTLADELLVIAREQLRAGVGVGLDVTRAEAQRASIRAQLIAARNTRDRARLELQRALGLPLDASVELADSLGALPLAEPVPDEAAALAAALERRPDLRAAREQLVAARRALGATRAERLPSLAAFGDDGYIGKDWGTLLNTYTWGVQLSLPILDGFRREGRVEEQQALARELEVRLKDLDDQAAIEVRGARLDLASAREQVEAARERLRLAEQELSQARDRFRAGVSGNADVITASLALNGSRTLLLDALTAYQAARVSLARATGSVTTLD